MRAKNLNEMSSMSGGSMTMAPKKVSTAAVYKKDKKKNGKKHDQEWKSASISETVLRNAIRNLIFLNKVKYHEEQVKRELQEQKLRRVIRYLLKEADSTRSINFDTTGAAAAWEFIQLIQKGTFENDFANSLVSNKEQRDTFKIVYLTSIKNYLDSLDQQYLIMHPEDRPGGQAAPQEPAPAPMPTDQSSTGTTPDMNQAAPAKRGDVAIEEQGEVHPSAGVAVPTDEPPSTDRIQTQAIQSALSAAGSQLERYGVNAAKEALKRDLPQIDPLYFNLTFKPFTTSTGRTTSDKQEFRYFLIGDSTRVGNLQLKFKEWNDNVPLKNAQQGMSPDTPKLEPDPLNLPGADGTAAPAPAAPAGAGAPLTPNELGM